jgi:hypothetical protein
MSLSGTITLTSVASNMTTFDLYSCSTSSNSSCSGTAFETNVTKDSLVSGYQTNIIPDGTQYIKINANTGACNGTYKIVQFQGVPALTQTPTVTPTMTPTPSGAAGVSSILLSSGTTVGNACTGATQTYYYQTPNPPTIPSFGYDGKQIYTDSTLLTPAPGSNSHIIYYYSSDYNTVYYVSDSEGRKYDAHTICPTPTPLTGTVVNAIVSTVSGDDACNGGDVDLSQFYTLIIYGSNIQNASAIINLPSELLSYFSDNQQFWVKARVGGGGGFYWKKFILDGTPSPSVVANSSGVATACPL